MSQNQNHAHHPAQSHTRINDTLLGSSEKKALLWLAARMPAWVVPDTLTLLGLFASVLIFVSYALTNTNRAFLWLASFGFVLHWLGDSLDGTLARYRKIERPRYGFFVDHIIDTISEVLIFIGLGLSPYLDFNLALLALVGYMLLGTYVYLVTYVNGVFRISYGRLGPTETRVIALIANAVVFFAGKPIVHLTLSRPLAFQASLTFYDLVVIFVTLLEVGFFAASTLTTAMSLSREDRARSAKEKVARRAAAAARRQALRDERVMRKNAARAARERANMEPDR